MQGADCEMTDEFFAGLFAGEGFVGMWKTTRGYALAVILQMTDLPLVTAIQRRFGGTLSKRPGVGRNRTVWRWVATNGSRRPVLEVLSRYCTGDKKNQVDLAMQYVSEFGEGSGVWGGTLRTSEQKQRQEWYYLEMRKLKKVEYLEQELSYAS